ncbi:RNA binding motif-containing protein, putative [Babesia caballi]|uniref:RNA binding motif-containing protein, putative n=1 Tax=Babesia caballi TaxID=5871 RepID=A0AAV4LYK0_BABCB|nr:RNA binding motif-containing protein, putative [Babesia caballi]
MASERGPLRIRPPEACYPWKAAYQARHASAAHFPSECEMEAGKTLAHSVLVRNLRYETTTQTVREAFERFGKIRDVYLPLEFDTQEPRGFGFVEFSQSEAAAEAVKAMDNATLDGSVVTCCLAQDRRKSPNSMRRTYRNVDSYRRYDGVAPGGRRPDYYGRPRSRSRSPFARYAQRSPSFDRHYVAHRGERPFYSRYEHDRSPGRYHLPYHPPARDYRDERDHRDGREPRDYREHRGYGGYRDLRDALDYRPEHVSREPRRYPERSHHADYASSRRTHDHRISPPRGHEGRHMNGSQPEPSDLHDRRPEH